MNIIQDIINKGILKFPEKKEAMAIDKDQFPLVASINIATTNLRELLNAKKARRFSPSANIRKEIMKKKFSKGNDVFPKRDMFFQGVG